MHLIRLGPINESRGSGASSRCSKKKKTSGSKFEALGQLRSRQLACTTGLEEDAEREGRGQSAGTNARCFAGGAGEEVRKACGSRGRRDNLIRQAANVIFESAAAAGSL